MNILKLLKIKIKIFLKPNGLTDFLHELPKKTRLLDIGCGNESPKRIKSILPKSFYVGVDIGDYNQTLESKKFADKYILTSSERFCISIKEIDNKFDAIISRHNIEHCENRNDTLLAMSSKLESNGRIFLSFPSEETINYPSRRGTLNYFDDKTHKDNPPNFKNILEILKKNGLEILYANKKYQPRFLTFIGLLIEPISFLRNKVMLGTWEKYGFESIIIAKRK